MRNRKIVHMAMLITLGLLLFLFESLIPRPLPWAKPGFSQIATLIALYLWGWREAVVLVTARICLAALVAGGLAGPAFWIALPSAIAAALMMAAWRSAAGDRFSILGISVVGALTHNVIQLFMAYVLLVRHSHIFYLFPLLWLPALFTGLIVGVIASAALSLLKRAAFQGEPVRI